MSRRPKRFVIVMDWVFSSFQELIKRGIDRYSRSSGVEVAYLGVGNMSQIEPDQLARQALFELVSDRDFEGAVFVTTSLINVGGKEALAERMRSLRMPFVSIGPSLIGEDSVTIDNTSGMREIMKHMIETHGYRSYAYVSGPMANPDARSRLEAFRASLDEAGMKRSERDEYYGDFEADSGQAAVAELLGKRGLRSEVIVCANDFMATGVWAALLDRGLFCPGDIAVTGFDDINLMHSISHQFTTVRQSFDDLAFMAALRLEAISSGKSPEGPIMLKPPLRVRASCGCVDTQPTLDKARAEEINSEIRDLIDRARDIVRGKDLRHGTRDLCRAWADIARRHISLGKQPYELEEILRGARAFYAGPETDKDAEALINALHATLLNECAQAAFINTWKERLFLQRLRSDLESLESAIDIDLTLSSHAKNFDAIAERCKAKAFYVARILERDLPLSQAQMIYSRVGSKDIPDPKSGSFLPSCGCNIAVNMLTADNRCYGFYVIDSDSAPSSAFEHLQTRLSSILRNQSIMEKDRRINEDMVREIRARADSERRLKDALAMVEQLSIEDELTGLSNRRGFMNLAEQQVKLLRRNRSGFFVLYADLDGLKKINDSYGHADGDLALKSAAEILRESLRESDIVARIGGDEFTALISQAMPPNIDIIEKRIISGCERKSARLVKGWRISFSIGHFYSDPDCVLSVAKMLKLADAELYKVKQRKRAATEGQDA